MTTLAEFSADRVAISPEFSGRIAELRQKFFSRDPDLWPVFRDPGLAHIVQSRKSHASPSERIKQYPNGEMLYEKLKSDTRIPKESRPPGESHSLVLFAAALSKAWEDPGSVENVITMPCDPAIYGGMIGQLANPNLCYREYCEMADELEKVVVQQMARLAGYDPAKATGIFTQGGTFCNMYGYLFGIRKTMPESLHLGLEYGQDYRIINSQGGHYSNTTNLSVLGVNISKKTIRLKLTEANHIDLHDLEQQLNACYLVGCVVPTIMLTMGTTDTFGVDEVRPVYDLCQKLCKRHRIAVPPHIHVDAAVGWPMIFFLDYDFQNNPLHINPATLAGIERNVAKFREIRYADSFTVDFQKWGFVPYTSSLVMVKDRASMKALEHDPENFSYFERDVQGQTHLQSTIECSRGASGVFAAYSAMQYLGQSGYQALIAHGLQNANYFRYRLSQIPGTVQIAPENQGPSVGFRLYDPNVVTNPEAEYEFEKGLSSSSEYRQRVERNTNYHRNIFLKRGKRGLYTNWVQFVSHTDYDQFGRWEALAGEKAVFMNPMTDAQHIDLFLQKLHG